MESGFAKKLADTGTSIFFLCAFPDVSIDQSVRDKAVSALKKWLKTEGDKLAYPEYLKLWKGLFYSKSTSSCAHTLIFDRHVDG